MDADPQAAKDWRTRAKERLAGRFILLDPLRRNFRDNEIDSSNEIVEFDLQDVRDADLLLVNYCKPSLGTAMEVFYASHDLGKFVIAFSPSASRIARPGWCGSAPRSCPTSKARWSISSATSPRKL